MNKLLETGSVTKTRQNGHRTSAGVWSDQKSEENTLFTHRMMYKSSAKDLPGRSLLQKKKHDKIHTQNGLSCSAGQKMSRSY
jgi:hypothetical protein